MALAGVDLAVDAGEVLAVVGPNGAGKTTLLSAVVGLVDVDEGEIVVAGVDARARPAAARRVTGVAPQRLGLSPTLTVEQNLVFAGRLAGLPAPAARSAAAEVAEVLGLGPLLGRPAGRLSGGEQRRVHVGCAVVHRPALVLLDEPSSGVDPAARQAILDLVRRLAADGAAVVFSTHLLDEVEDLGASVAILHRGRVVARDGVAALVERHGRSVVELRFDADVDAGVPLPLAGAVVDGPLVRLTTDDPGRALAQVLAALAGQSLELVSVDVNRPGLGTVFLALTGEPYPGGGG